MATTSRSESPTVLDLCKAEIGKQSQICRVCRGATGGKPVYRVEKCLCEARAEAGLQRNCGHDGVVLCRGCEVHVRCANKADEVIERTNVVDENPDVTCPGCGEYEYSCCCSDDDDRCGGCDEYYDYCECG